MKNLFNKISLCAFMVISSLLFLVGCGNPYANMKIETSSESLNLYIEADGTVKEPGKLGVIIKGGSGKVKPDVLVDVGQGGYIKIDKGEKKGRTTNLVVTPLKPGTTNISLKTSEGNASKVVNVVIHKRIAGLSWDLGNAKKVGVDRNTFLDLNKYLHYEASDTTERDVEFVLADESSKNNAFIDGSKLKIKKDANFPEGAERIVSVFAVSKANPEVKTEILKIDVLDIIDVNKSKIYLYQNIAEDGSEVASPLPKYIDGYKLILGKNYNRTSDAKISLKLHESSIVSEKYYKVSTEIVDENLDRIRIERIANSDTYILSSGVNAGEAVVKFRIDYVGYEGQFTKEISIKVDVRDDMPLNFNFYNEILQEEILDFDNEELVVLDSYGKKDPNNILADCLKLRVGTKSALPNLKFTVKYNPNGTGIESFPGENEGKENFKFYIYKIENGKVVEVLPGDLVENNSIIYITYDKGDIVFSPDVFPLLDFEMQYDLSPERFGYVPLEGEPKFEYETFYVKKASLKLSLKEYIGLTDGVMTKEKRINAVTKQAAILNENGVVEVSDDLRLVKFPEKAKYDDIIKSIEIVGDKKLISCVAVDGGDRPGVYVVPNDDKLTGVVTVIIKTFSGQKKECKVTLFIPNAYINENDNNKPNIFVNIEDSVFLEESIYVVDYRYFAISEIGVFTEIFYTDEEVATPEEQKINEIIYSLNKNSSYLAEGKIAYFKTVDNIKMSTNAKISFKMFNFMVDGASAPVPYLLSSKDSDYILYSNFNDAGEIDIDGSSFISKNKEFFETYNAEAEVNKALTLTFDYKGYTSYGDLNTKSVSKDVYIQIIKPIKVVSLKDRNKDLYIEDSVGVLDFNKSTFKIEIINLQNGKVLVNDEQNHIRVRYALANAEDRITSFKSDARIKDVKIKDVLQIDENGNVYARFSKEIVEFLKANPVNVEDFNSAIFDISNRSYKVNGFVQQFNRREVVDSCDIKLKFAEKIENIRPVNFNIQKGIYFNNFNTNGQTVKLKVTKDTAYNKNLYVIYNHDALSISNLDNDNKIGGQNIEFSVSPRNTVAQNLSIFVAAEDSVKAIFEGDQKVVPNLAEVTVNNVSEYFSNFIEIRVRVTDGSEFAPYEIHKESDLRLLNNSDKYWVLAEKISLTDSNFESIYNFSGNLNGQFSYYNGKYVVEQNYISNLRIERTNAITRNFGLFANLAKTAVVRNLVIHGASIKLTDFDYEQFLGNVNVGVIAGENKGEIINSRVILGNIELTFENLISVNAIKQFNVGGFVGENQGLISSDSNMDSGIKIVVKVKDGNNQIDNAKYKLKQFNIGGIAGLVLKEIVADDDVTTLENVDVLNSVIGNKFATSIEVVSLQTAEGKTQLLQNKNFNINVGGIVGFAEGLENANVLIKDNSMLNINLMANGNLAGFVGKASNAFLHNNSLQFSESIKNPLLYLQSGNIGGFVGEACNNVYVYYNYVQDFNKADISAEEELAKGTIFVQSKTANIGGFIGKTSGNTNISNSYFNANILVTEPAVANEVTSKPKVGIYIGSENNESGLIKDSFFNGQLKLAYNTTETMLQPISDLTKFEVNEYRYIDVNSAERICYFIYAKDTNNVYSLNNYRIKTSYSNVKYTHGKTGFEIVENLNSIYSTTDFRDKFKVEHAGKDGNLILADLPKNIIRYDGIGNFTIYAGNKYKTAEATDEEQKAKTFTYSIKVAKPELAPSKKDETFIIYNHTELKNYICYNCGTMFDTLDEAKKHICGEGGNAESIVDMNDKKLVEITPQAAEYNIENGCAIDNSSVDPADIISQERYEYYYCIRCGKALTKEEVMAGGHKHVYDYNGHDEIFESYERLTWVKGDEPPVSEVNIFPIMGADENGAYIIGKGKKPVYKNNAIPLPPVKVSKKHLYYVKVCENGHVGTSEYPGTEFCKVDNRKFNYFYYSEIPAYISARTGEAFASLEAGKAARPNDVIIKVRHYENIDGVIYNDIRFTENNIIVDNLVATTEFAANSDIESAGYNYTANYLTTMGNFAKRKFNIYNDAKYNVEADIKNSIEFGKVDWFIDDNSVTYKEKQLNDGMPLLLKPDSNTNLMYSVIPDKIDYEYGSADSLIPDFKVIGDAKSNNVILFLNKTNSVYGNEYINDYSIVKEITENDETEIVIKDKFLYIKFGTDLILNNVNVDVIKDFNIKLSNRNAELVDNNTIRTLKDGEVELKVYSIVDSEKQASFNLNIVKGASNVNLYNSSNINDDKNIIKIKPTLNVDKEAFYYFGAENIVDNISYDVNNNLGYVLDVSYVNEITGKEIYTPFNLLINDVNYNINASDEFGYVGKNIVVTGPLNRFKIVGLQKTEENCVVRITVKPYLATPELFNGITEEKLSSISGYWLKDITNRPNKTYSFYIAGITETPTLNNISDIEIYPDQTSREVVVSYVTPNVIKDENGNIFIDKDNMNMKIRDLLTGKEQIIKLNSVDGFDYVNSSDNSQNSEALPRFNVQIVKQKIVKCPAENGVENSMYSAKYEIKFISNLNWFKYNTKNNNKYEICFFSDTNDNKDCKLMFNINEPKLESITSKYYSYGEKKNDGMNFSEKENNVVFAETEGLLKIDLYPTVNDADFVKIKLDPSTKQNCGKVSLKQYVGLAETEYGYVTGYAPIYGNDFIQILDDGIILENSSLRLNGSVNNLFNGKFYVGVLLGDKAVDKTTFKFSIEAYKNSNKEKPIASEVKELRIRVLPSMELTLADGNDPVTTCGFSRKFKLTTENYQLPNENYYNLSFDVSGDNTQFSFDNFILNSERNELLFDLSSTSRCQAGLVTVMVSTSVVVEGLNIELKSNVELHYVKYKIKDVTINNVFNDKMEVLLGVENPLSVNVIAEVHEDNNDAELSYEYTKRYFEQLASGREGGYSNWFEIKNQSTFVRLGDEVKEFADIQFKGLRVGNSHAFSIMGVKVTPQSLIRTRIRFELKLGYSELGYPIMVRNDDATGIVGKPFKIVKDFGVFVKDNSTYDHPIPIHDVNEFRESVQKYGNYILVNDIVLSNWQPVPCNVKSLDGNGFRIIINSFDFGLTNEADNVLGGVFTQISPLDGTNSDSLENGTGTSGSTKSVLKNITIDVSNLLYDKVGLADVLSKAKSTPDVINNISTPINLYTNKNKNVKFGLLSAENHGTISNAKVISTRKLNNSEDSHDNNILVLTNSKNEGGANKIVGGLVGVNYGSINNSFIGVPTDSNSTETRLSIEMNIAKRNGEDTIRSSITVYPFSIKGSNVLGGMVGVNNGIITNSYVSRCGLDNFAELMNENNKTGGFVAENAGSIVNCFVQGADFVNYRATIARVSLGSRAGEIGAFVHSNAGAIENAFSNIGIRLEAGTKFAGFVYENEGNITNAYACSYGYDIYNSGDGNSSNVNRLLNGLFTGATKSTVGEEEQKYNNNGIYKNCYYLSLTKNGISETKDNEPATAIETNVDDIRKEQESAPEDGNGGDSQRVQFRHRGTFSGFLFNYGQNENGIWKMPANPLIGPQLISCEKETLSIRKQVGNFESTDHKYMYQYNLYTPYGSDRNPILVNDADEFITFILNNSSNANIYNELEHDVVETPIFGVKPMSNSDSDIMDSNAYSVRLINHLDFKEYKDGAEGKNIMKINNVDGKSFRYLIFLGNLDGNGFKMSNINISDNIETRNRENFGLFNQIGLSKLQMEYNSIYNGSTNNNNNLTVGLNEQIKNSAKNKPPIIKNLDMSFNTVSAADCLKVGALAGSIYNSNLYNINITFNLNSDDDTVIGKNIVGGLAGLIEGDVKLNSINIDSFKGYAVRRDSTEDILDTDVVGSDGFVEFKDGDSVKCKRMQSYYEIALLKNIVENNIISKKTVENKDNDIYTKYFERYKNNASLAKIKNLSYVGAIAGVINAQNNEISIGYDYAMNINATSDSPAAPKTATDDSKDTIREKINAYRQKNNTEEIQNLKATGQIGMIGANVGGLFGYIGEKTLIKDSSLLIGEDASGGNGIKIIGYNFAGGIVGENYGALEKVKVEFVNQKTLDKEFYLKGKRPNASESIDYIFKHKKPGAVAISLTAIGGIAGFSNGGRIVDSYSRINVINNFAKSAGGIVGLAYNNLVLSHVYSTADVYGQFNIGGIIGAYWQEEQCEINVKESVLLPPNKAVDKDEDTKIDTKLYIKGKDKDGNVEYKVIDELKPGYRIIVNEFEESEIYTKIKYIAYDSALKEGLIDTKYIKYIKLLNGRENLDSVVNLNNKLTLDYVYGVNAWDTNKLNSLENGEKQLVLNNSLLSDGGVVENYKLKAFGLAYKITKELTGNQGEVNENQISIPLYGNQYINNQDIELSTQQKRNTFIGSIIGRIQKFGKSRIISVGEDVTGVNCNIDEIINSETIDKTHKGLRKVSSITGLSRTDEHPNNEVPTVFGSTMLNTSKYGSSNALKYDNSQYFGVQRYVSEIMSTIKDAIYGNHFSAWTIDNLKLDDIGKYGSIIWKVEDGFPEYISGIYSHTTLIATEKDFVKNIYNVDSTKGKAYTLASDITITDTYADPAYENKNFEGILIGNGKTITIKTNSYLFNKIVNATLMDINFNIEIDSTRRILVNGDNFGFIAKEIGASAINNIEFTINNIPPKKGSAPDSILLNHMVERSNTANKYAVKNFGLMFGDIDSCLVTNININANNLKVELNNGLKAELNNDSSNDGYVEFNDLNLGLLSAKAYNCISIDTINIEDFKGFDIDGKTGQTSGKLNIEDFKGFKIDGETDQTSGKLNVGTVLGIISDSTINNVNNTNTDIFDISNMNFGNYGGTFGIIENSANVYNIYETGLIKLTNVNNATVGGVVADINKSSTLKNVIYTNKAASKIATTEIPSGIKIYGNISNINVGSIAGKASGSRIAGDEDISKAIYNKSFKENEEENKDNYIFINKIINNNNIEVEKAEVAAETDSATNENINIGGICGNIYSAGRGKNQRVTFDRVINNAKEISIYYNSKNVLLKNSRISTMFVNSNGGTLDASNLVNYANIKTLSNVQNIDVAGVYAAATAANRTDTSSITSFMQLGNIQFKDATNVAQNNNDISGVSTSNCKVEKGYFVGRILNVGATRKGNVNHETTNSPVVGLTNQGSVSGVTKYVNNESVDYINKDSSKNFASVFYIKELLVAQDELYGLNVLDLESILIEFASFSGFQTDTTNSNKLLVPYLEEMDTLANVKARVAYNGSYYLNKNNFVNVSNEVKNNKVNIINSDITSTLTFKNGTESTTEFNGLLIGKTKTNGTYPIVKLDAKLIATNNGTISNLSFKINRNDALSENSSLFVNVNEINGIINNCLVYGNAKLTASNANTKVANFVINNKGKILNSASSVWHTEENANLEYSEIANNEGFVNGFFTTSQYIDVTSSKVTDNSFAIKGEFSASANITLINLDETGSLQNIYFAGFIGKNKFESAGGVNTYNKQLITKTVNSNNRIYNATYDEIACVADRHIAANVNGKNSNFEVETKEDENIKPHLLENYGQKIIYIKNHKLPTAVTIADGLVSNTYVSASEANASIPIINEYMFENLYSLNKTITNTVINDVIILKDTLDIKKNKVVQITGHNIYGNNATIKNISGFIDIGSKLANENFKYLGGWISSLNNQNIKDLKFENIQIAYNLDDKKPIGVLANEIMLNAQNTTSHYAQNIKFNSIKFVEDMAVETSVDGGFGVVAGFINNKNNEKLFIIKDVEISALEVTTPSANVGGFVGYAENTEFENCDVSGKVKGKENVGGFAGYAEFKISIKGENLINAEIECGNNAGGIVGLMGRDNSDTATYSDSLIVDSSSSVVVSGKVTVSATTLSPLGENAGGIVGRLSSSVKFASSNNSDYLLLNNFIEIKNPSHASIIVNAAVVSYKNAGLYIGYNNANFNNSIKFGYENLNDVKNVETDKVGTVAMAGEGSKAVGIFAGYNNGTIDGDKVSILNYEKDSATGGYKVSKAPINITNNGNTFGIFAGVNAGTIQNCINGSVKVVENKEVFDSSLFKLNGSTNVGSIAGENLGTIKDCKNLAEINGTENIGGIVGLNKGTISTTSIKVENRGKISGTKNIGGIAGTSTNEITNAVNNGEVSGNENIGGIVGVNNGSITDVINNSKINSESKNVGGIAGVSKAAETEQSEEAAPIAETEPQISPITNAVNNGGIVGVENVGGLVGENSGNITGIGEFGTQDSENPTGEFDNNADIKGRKNVGGIVGNTLTNNSVLTNVRSSASILGNSNVGGLVGQTGNSDDANNINGGIIENNSSMTSNSSVYGSVGFTGTGEYTGENIGGVVGKSNRVTINNLRNYSVVTGKKYVGGFVGSGIVIIHDSSNVGGITGENNVGGFLGYGNLTIRNSGNNAAITGVNNVGGIAGKAYRVSRSIASAEEISINNSNNGKVEATGENVGGIFGVIDNMKVKGFKNGGVVIGIKNVGGIAGSIADGVDSNENGNIVECINENSDIIEEGKSPYTVKGTENVGGIVGYSYRSIENCINKGSVLGTNNVGGIAGKFANGKINEVRNEKQVDAELKVTGTGNNVGGIVGEFSTTKNSKGMQTNVTKVYNNSDVVGVNNVGGVVGFMKITYPEDDWTTFMKPIDVAKTYGNVTGNNYVAGHIGYLKIENDEENYRYFYFGEVAVNKATDTYKEEREVKAKNFGAGLVGYFEHDENLKIEIYGNECKINNLFIISDNNDHKSLITEYDTTFRKAFMGSSNSVCYETFNEKKLSINGWWNTENVATKGYGGNGITNYTTSGYAVTQDYMFSNNDTLKNGVLTYKIDKEVFNFGLICASEKIGTTSNIQGVQIGKVKWDTDKKKYVSEGATFITQQWGVRMTVGVGGVALNERIKLEIFMCETYCVVSDFDGFKTHVEYIFNNNDPSICKKMTLEARVKIGFIKANENISDRYLKVDSEGSIYQVFKGKVEKWENDATPTIDSFKII